MEFLQYLFENSQFSFISAFVLGLMTAISPCPLATNITALVYTLGRAISYTTIGLLFFFGISRFELTSIFQQWGEKLLGPILILIGLFMLGILSFRRGGINTFIQKYSENRKVNFWSVLIIGILFALAFVLTVEYCFLDCLFR